MTAGPPTSTRPLRFWPLPRARFRSVRFFTHLPGTGPSPVTPGRPGRTHQGRARAARPFAGERTASRSCPAPHQAGHRPNNRPPLPAAIPRFPPREYRAEKSNPLPEIGSDQEQHGSNSFQEIEYPRIISYNLNEGERPGGLKVRYKIRIETGRKADALNAQQAAAIKELLPWTRQHRRP